MTTRLLTVSLILASGIAQGQGARIPKTNSVPSIRSYCDGQEAQAKKSRSTQILFSAVPQNQNPARDKWQRQAAEKEQMAAADNGNSTASVYQAARHVVVALFSFQSEFGDWGKLRGLLLSTGRLAGPYLLAPKQFSWDMTVIRTYFFDSRGGRLALERNDYQLSTGTPKKIDSDFWDFPPPIFLHVGDLPLAQELR